MRVCMIAYSFYESDSRIMQYAHSLTARGDSVDVIALSHNEAPREEIIDGVHVYRVQSREINERGALSYLFRIIRFLLVAMAVLTWKHLRSRYQLVHVHSVPDFLVAAALPLRVAGVPVILDIHDILPEFYASKFGVGQKSLIFRALVLIEKLSAAIASHVIIANHLWYQRLIKRSVSEQKCSVICNYPDPQLFYLRPKENTNGRFQIMYPGSLNWHQGIDIAVRAFAKVAGKMEGAEFVVYGEGPARPELERLIEELGLKGKMHVHDYRPTSEIAALMSNADLAVVPKRASSSFGTEAASTKIQEFMAVGVPVIVSRTKIDSLYFNDSNVRFFESENVEALAEAILELYEHPDRRQSLVEHANRHIQQNNWDVKQHEYLSIVKSLVGTQPPPAGDTSPSRGKTPEFSRPVRELLEEYYRCPELMVSFSWPGDLSVNPGYFRISDKLVGYGRLSESQAIKEEEDKLPEAAVHVKVTGSSVAIPFDPVEVVNNLRLEQYTAALKGSHFPNKKLARRVYYHLRPLMPVAVRKYLQRLALRGWERIPFPRWPVDRTSDRLHEWLLASAMKAAGQTELPFVWFWPEGHTSCVTVTHDVESKRAGTFVAN